MTGIVKRVQNWLTGEARRAELDRMGEVELSKIAQDAGVSAGELKELAQLGPDAADLLPRRMQAIGLDVDQVGRKEPGSLRDMQRLCARCEAHGRCERDLSSRPDDAVWQTYCPNVVTLRALQEDSPH
jgi:hypothetical protein